MISFNIKLAEIVIRINALYASTKSFFNDYLFDDKQDFEISICDLDIDYEKSKSTGDYNYSNEYLETLAIYRKIVEEMINYDVLLFHGTVIVKDDKAYLFTAPSGTGKTTHCKLWLKNIKDSYILNGDKPLIKIKDDEVRVYGTPYQGKENYGFNSSCKLKSIILVNRDINNHIERVNYADVFTKIYTQTYEFKDKAKVIKQLSLLSKLKGISFFNLYCNMSDDAAIIAYEGLNHE